MPERPLVLFPSPEKADRTAKKPVFTNINKPSYSRQFNRLQPSFNVLREAFRNKNIQIQQSPVGMNPDYALVFETVGSVDKFYTAVHKCDGLEWLFDIDSGDITPDEDFYIKDKEGNRIEKTLSGKLYCVMTNQQALNQVLSLWERHSKGEKDVFKTGFKGLRDVFNQLKTVRKWDASDRFNETGILESWREYIQLVKDEVAPFEIELFFRNDIEKRKFATQIVSKGVTDLGGNVLQECILPEISYHALLVQLPRNVIEKFVEKYDSIELSHIDDIMFFRPGSQAAHFSPIHTEKYDNTLDKLQTESKGVPIAAILDGMPLQNHPLLKGRVIVDDPDDYAQNYTVKDRLHGTEMASLVIYGDLSKKEEPITHPVYVRPIFKPKEVGFEAIEECIPSNVLFVDVLHRAIKRIKEGDNGMPPVSPDIHIVNLSLGDRSRQLGNVMSPTARLIDYLAYKYKLLFVISAGNHEEILRYIHSSFQDLKSLL